MSVAPTSEPTSQPALVAGLEIPLPPTDLPFDDGETLESNRHRLAMNTLIRSLQQAWRDCQDFFTGGNMFIYFSSAQARNQDFRGPDFFVVLDIDGSYPRQSWVVWEEGGRYPDVIVEFLSPKTAKEDLGTKKDVYERVFRTRDYFVFDPFDPNSLRGWHLDSNDRYQELVPNERGWLWCQKLEFWLGSWEGTIDREAAVWLRFYDAEGNLVPLPEEAAQQQGLEQGLQQGAQRPLLRLLQRRFGTVPSEVQASLQAMSVAQLEELVEVALEVESLDDFVRGLSGDRFC